MALIAVTNIDHGRAGADGVENFYFDAGDEIDESVFTDEEMDNLRRAGAVEDSVALDEVQDLRKQVEELQRELARRESEHAAVNNSVTNARVVDQSAPDPQRGVEAGTILDEDGKPAEKTEAEAAARPKPTDKTTAESPKTSSATPSTQG